MCARCGSFNVSEHAGWLICNHCGDTWEEA